MLIGAKIDIQLCLGVQTPMVGVGGWGEMGEIKRRMCRSSGRWWMACSCLRRGMANPPGMLAGLGVTLT